MSNFNAFENKIDTSGEKGVGERYSRSIKKFRKEFAERVTTTEDELRSKKIPLPFPSLNQEDNRNWILRLPKPPENAEKISYIPIAVGDTNEYVVCVYSKHDVYLRAVGILKEKDGLKKDDEQFKIFYVKTNQGYKVTLDERYYWVEFKPEDEDEDNKYFTNSNCLPITCSYQDRNGSKSMADISINPSSLKTLIVTMHSVNPATIPKPKLGDFMNTLCLLTSEGIRFRTIEYLFINQLNMKYGVRNFGNDNVGLIQVWSNYSESLLKVDMSNESKLREARKHVAVCLYDVDSQHHQ